MRNEFLAVFRTTKHAGLVFGCSLVLSSQAFAMQAGHGRVDSAPGAALQMSIPLNGLTASDLTNLQVKPAAAEDWTKAGLTPPVGLASLTVAIEPGFSQDSRMLVLRSTQAVDREVIDVLLDVSSASGSTKIQSSFLVLTKANMPLSGGTVTVKNGDTLIGIALNNATPGADMYQMLWALYQANPQAFYSNNMNLLRVGSTLQIPDADAVRAIDSKLARSMHQKHLNEFKTMRGANTATNTRAPQTVASPAGATQSSRVSTVVPAPTPAPADRVKLTSANPADQRADARTSASKEIADIQARVDSLQQNVQQLKEAVGQAPTSTRLDNLQQNVQQLKEAVSQAPTAARVESLQQNVQQLRDALKQTPTTARVDGLQQNVDQLKEAMNQSAAKANAAAEEGAGGMLSKVWAVVSNHVQAILIGVLAIGGLLVAWLLIRTGARRGKGRASKEAAKADVDQQLKDIDLNLSAGAAGKAKPAAKVA